MVDIVKPLAMRLPPIYRAVSFSAPTYDLMSKWAWWGDIRYVGVDAMKSLFLQLMGFYLFYNINVSPLCL